MTDNEQRLYRIQDKLLERIEELEAGIRLYLSGEGYSDDLVGLLGDSKEEK